MNPDSTLTNTKLLPDQVRRSHWLLWVWVLPMCILVMLNYHYWWLIEGEMGSEHRKMAMIWGGYNLANLVIGVSLFGYLRLRGRMLGTVPGGLILLLQCGYLILTTLTIRKVVPWTVDWWIVSVPRLLMVQWTWVMPAAAYGVLLLTGFPLRGSRGGGIIGSIAAIILGPSLAYLGGIVGEGGFKDLAVLVTLFLFVVGTLLLGFGVMRLLLILFFGFGERKYRMAVFIVLFALIFPLGGLWLNRKIPFPADYQDTWVYVFTVINALVLFIPKSSSRCVNLGLLLLRSFCLPFTLYFFLVFLPYLPASLFAIFAAGAGFLILSPTILMVLHLVRLRELWLLEFSLDRRVLGILCVLAFAVIPSYITLESLYLRRQLEKGLAWVYAPDTERMESFDGNPEAISKASRWLKDYKDGRFLPYLSTYREWLMFDGLVLPDDKLARIYEAFSGKSFEDELGQDARSIDVIESVMGRGIRRGNRITRRSLAEPNREVKLVGVETSSILEEGIVRTTVSLEIESTGKREVAEYACLFALPEGVLVSGFWLYINGVREPGRLFEKKAALWVYQMIRDGRRDPGVLYYTGPNLLSLRVFPIEWGERRRVEFELIYPEGLIRDFEIDGQHIRLGGISRVAGTSSDASVVVLNKPALDELPLIERRPYLHFIVDDSLEGPSKEEVVRRIEAVRALLPSVDDLRITQVNYERRGQFADVAEFLEADERVRLGGFSPARAILEEMVLYEKSNLRRGGTFDQFPLFVIVSNRDESTWPLDLREVSAWAPEVDGVLKASEEEIYTLDWEGMPLSWNVSEVGSPVGVLAMGESVRVVKEGQWNAQVIFSPDVVGEPLCFLATGNRTFVPMSDVSVWSAKEAYGAGVALDAAVFDVEKNPALLEDRLGVLVEKSKAQKILIPLTTYIVVESTAQWRALEALEKETLDGNPDLELMETPEPELWLLGGMLIVWEYVRRRRNAGSCAKRSTGGSR